MDLDHEDLDNVENELGQPALLPRLILPVSPLMAGMAVADLPDLCPLASHEMVLLFIHITEDQINQYPEGKMRSPPIE